MNTSKEPSPVQPVDSKTPVLIEGGFGHDHLTNANTTGHVRRLGYTALDPLADPSISDAPKGYRIRHADGRERTVSRLLTYFLAPMPEIALISSQQQEKRADEVIDHVKERSSGPVNGIFQSADAQNGLIAAHRQRDLFKNIVFAFPAGLVKKRGVVEYTAQMLRGAVKYRGDKHVPHSSDDFELSKRAKSLRERRRERKFAKSGGTVVARSVAVAYQNELLHEVRQGADAPGVALFLGLKDSIARPDRVIESVISANDVDRIHITNTKHGWNGSKKMMNTILGLFEDMDEIMAKRKAGQAVGPLAARVSFAEDVSAGDRESILKLVRQLDARSGSKSST